MTSYSVSTQSAVTNYSGMRPVPTNVTSPAYEYSVTGLYDCCISDTDAIKRTPLRIDQRLPPTEAPSIDGADCSTLCIRIDGAGIARVTSSESPVEIPSELALLSEGSGGAHLKHISQGFSNSLRYMYLRFSNWDSSSSPASHKVNCLMNRCHFVYHTRDRGIPRTARWCRL